MRLVLAWALLAAAILALPLGNPLAERVRGLRERGRLAAPAGRRRQGLALRSVVDGFGPGAAALVAGTSVGGLAGIRAGPILGCAAGLLAGAAAYLSVGALRARAVLRSADQLRRAVRAAAAEVAAGGSAAAALRAAAEADPSRAEIFAAAAASAERGDEPGAALTAPVDGTGSLAVGTGSGAGAGSAARAGSAAGAAAGAGSGAGATAGLGGFARAWTVAALTGAPIAEVLGRLAADLDARAERRRQVASALAGPRSSAVVLALLPALGLALGAAMGAAPWSELVGSPAGQAVALLGVVLDLAGLAWTRRLAGSAERE